MYTILYYTLLDYCNIVLTTFYGSIFIKNGPITNLVQNLTLTREGTWRDATWWSFLCPSPPLEKKKSLLFLLLFSYRRRETRSFTLSFFFFPALISQLILSPEKKKIKKKLEIIYNQKLFFPFIFILIKRSMSDDSRRFCL